MHGFSHRHRTIRAIGDIGRTDSYLQCLEHHDAGRLAGGDARRLRPREFTDGRCSPGNDGNSASRRTKVSRLVDKSSASYEFRCKWLGSGIALAHGRNPKMLQCPVCGSAPSRFSRLRWAWETWRQQMTSTSLYHSIMRGGSSWRSSLITAIGALRATATRYLKRLAARRHVNLVIATVAPMVAAAAPARLDELDFDALNIPPR